MIISASRRTDIPALYGEWFINRIKEGYFYSQNPFNKNQVKIINISPDNVEAIVFWTKNPKPFFKYLKSLDDLGYNYYFHYTINNYPKLLEPNLPAIEDRIDSFLNLSSILGKKRVIWRYDPIIYSNLTDEIFHANNLNHLYNLLSEYTERMIISFFDPYYKVNNRLKKIPDLIIYDLIDEKHKIKLLNILEIIFNNISYENKVKVLTCSENINLINYNINSGMCIDNKLINEIFTKNIQYKKDNSQRKECLCAESIDVGVYNTCIHECLYCYANFSYKSIHNNYNNYHPNNIIISQKENKFHKQKKII